MSNLQVISNQNVLGNDFKIYGTFEEPLFLAKDVAEWIGYNADKVGQMLNAIDEDEQTFSPIFYSGQVRNMYFLTEDGMYEVLMQSRKPIAKQFKKQVKAILKEIRQTGRYEVQVPQNPMQALEMMFGIQKETVEKVEVIEKDVIDLKENQKLDAGEYGLVGRRVNERVRETIRNYNLINSQKVIGALQKDINGSIKRITGTSTRTQLRQKHFEEVLDFINSWTPSSATLHEVKQMNIEDVSNDSI